MEKAYEKAKQANGMDSADCHDANRLWRRRGE
jgi:hypothetical protein